MDQDFFGCFGRKKIYLTSELHITCITDLHIFTGITDLHVCDIFLGAGNRSQIGGGGGGGGGGLGDWLSMGDFYGHDIGA